MKSTNRWKAGASLALAWLWAAVLPASAGNDYRAGDFARVRFEENGLTIVRAETKTTREFLSAGRINTPVFAGDALATGPNQRAEAQLANGTLVRVDQYSHVGFKSLPDPNPESPDTTTLAMDEGGLRIEASTDTQKEFVLETPGCRTYVVGGSDLRVAVRGGRTRVATRRGAARIESGGSSLVLRAGMATEVIGGAAPVGPRPYNSFLADDFDRWVVSRQVSLAADLDLTAAAKEVYEALPVQVRPYFRELTLQGIWVRNDSFGHAWVPQVADPGWRPYRLGHWGYGQGGYFWISHEPWGWAPFHYGRWIWLQELGWAWIPGSVFSGAWVSWAWGDNYVGWCALDFWNLPATRRSGNESQFDPQSWTLVAYEDISRPDLVNHSVSLADNQDQVVTVQRPPRVSPRQLAEPAERIRALAAVRAESGSTTMTASATEMSATRASFLVLERQVDPSPAAAGQLAASEDSQPRRGDLQQAEFRATSLDTATGGKLEERSSGTVPQSPPTATRPLVRYGQQGVVGATERWRVIYRSVARPRPTESQTAPSPPTISEETEAQPAAPTPAADSTTRRSAEKKRGERGTRAP